VFAGKEVKVKLPLEFAIVVALSDWLPGAATAIRTVAPGFAPHPLTVKEVEFRAALPGYTCALIPLESKMVDELLAVPVV
jgi:hypothetical protein